MRVQRHRPLRVLVAPDGFGGSLTAGRAAEAIAQGWRRARPQDTVTLAPQSDGGPGFVELVAAAWPGDGSAHGSAAARWHAEQVTGPQGTPVAAGWLQAGDTAYLESAQACGIDLLDRRPDPDTAVAATSRGVGELIASAVAAGIGTVVVGLGGSACTDGGAGAADVYGGPGRMRAALAGVSITTAADVRSPLLGPDGAAAVYGPQKGAHTAETVEALESRLLAWARVLATETGAEVGATPGAGAAGGLGALLIAVGARMRSGAEIVGEATGRRAAIGRADVVVTGEGRLDLQTVRGKVLAHVAREARQSGTPVVVVAGQSALGEDEWRAMGAVAVHTSAEAAGSVEDALAFPVEHLTAAARRAAQEYVHAARGGTL